MTEVGRLVLRDGSPGHTIGQEKPIADESGVTQASQGAGKRRVEKSKPSRSSDECSNKHSDHHPRLSSPHGRCEEECAQHAFYWKSHPRIHDNSIIFLRETQVEAFHLLVGRLKRSTPHTLGLDRRRSGNILKLQEQKMPTEVCEPDPETGPVKHLSNIPLLPRDLEFPFLEPDGLSRVFATSDRLEFERFQTASSRLPNVLCQTRARSAEMPREVSRKVRISPRSARPWLHIVPRLYLSHASATRVLDQHPGLLSG
jgi:hypothetical protein